MINTIKEHEIKEVGEFNFLQIRVASKEYDGEELIDTKYHRYVLNPLSDYSNEPEEVKAKCEEVYTQEAKDAYSAYLESHKPVYTKDELIAILVSRINASTDKNIATGFSHNGIGFYLSLENQFNYKSVLDDALNGTLEYPYTIKGVGNNDFVVFSDIEEIKSFASAMKSHITNAIVSGWQEKSVLDSKTVEELNAMI